MPAVSTPYWTDMDATAVAISKSRFSQPFAGDNGEYILEQDFQQFLDSFAKLPLNSRHDVYTNYFLVSEGPLADVGGGMVKWTRRYAAVPSTRNDYASLSYNFIGYYGKTADIAIAVSLTVPLGRQRFTQSVKARLQNDYFLVDITGTIPGSVASVSAITITPALKYYVPPGSIVSSAFIPAYSPGSAQEMNFGTNTDFLWAITGANPYPGAIIPTRPDRSVYEGWITAGTEIVAEASQVARWEGNIYQRVTKYVLPL
jgi:hypothetical protein